MFICHALFKCGSEKQEWLWPDSTKGVGFEKLISSLKQRITFKLRTSNSFDVKINKLFDTENYIKVVDSLVCLIRGCS